MKGLILDSLSHCWIFLFYIQIDIALLFLNMLRLGLNDQLLHQPLFGRKYCQKSIRYEV